MASKNAISTPTHINSVGGETLTHAGEGAIIGAIVGASLGTILAVLKIRGDFLFLNLGTLSPFMIALLFVGGFTFCFTAAGLVVGVGVPKVNPHPEQGPVKTWKPIEVQKAGHSDTIFVPEETRNNRNSPMNWKKRDAEVFRSEQTEPNTNLNLQTNARPYLVKNQEARNQRGRGHGEVRDRQI